MAHKEEAEENTPRGNEWEVVSLTASAYAASPGPGEVELKDEDKGDTLAEAETSHALFMSRHFTLSLSEHENLPSEPISSEIHDDKVSKEIESEFGAEQEGKSHGKDEEYLTLEGLNLQDEFTRIPFLDEKGKKEDSIYSTAVFGSLHDETAIGGSTVYEEKELTSEQTEPSLEPGTDVSPALKPAKDEKHTGSNIPCEAWWRRTASSLYANAKEANAFWSVFIAAAVMGVVIFGQRWQQERWQVMQLKWQSDTGNEKAGRMSGPIFRLKDVIAGGKNRGSFIRTSSSNDN